MSDSLRAQSNKSETGDSSKESFKICRMTKFLEKKFGKSFNMDVAHDNIDYTNEYGGANPKESAIPIRKINKCVDLDKIKENLRMKRDKSARNDKLKRELSDKIKSKPLAVKSFSRSHSSSIPCLSEMKLKRRHSGTTVDTAFVQQVVEHKSSLASLKVSRSKSARVTSSTMEDRKQAALQAFANRRTPSPNVMAEDPNFKKKIDKALKVRFYLLQQRGPNSFLIGGDAPDHKYKVVIGPQSCSCTKKQCLHVLFVMLRVFKVERNDPALWSPQLKNFEVEALFRKYYQRREQRIADIKRRTNESIHSKNESGTASDGSLSEDSQDGYRLEDEEETCPICLSEILDGESLNNCDKCINKYHHHCLDRWFAECQKSERRLTCPLCDEKWHSNLSHTEVSPTSKAETLLFPSSPRLTSSDLPHANRVSDDLQPFAAEWSKVIGENLSSCLLSTNWNFRETGLKELSKTAIRTLLLTLQDDSSQVQAILQCSLRILAFTISDPVYKVFIQSLKTLRSILSFTPCRNDSERIRLENQLKSVVDSLLNKCADSNKKTKDVSLSAILGLIKGQEGELSIGKELDGYIPKGIDGLNLVLECISNMNEINETTSFQFFLGRLLTFELLLDRYRSFFLLNNLDREKSSGKRCNLLRVRKTIDFLRKAFYFNHMKVATLAKKLLFHMTKIQDDNGIKWILSRCDSYEVDMKEYLRKKLSNPKCFERTDEIKDKIFEKLSENHYIENSQVHNFVSATVSLEDTDSFLINDSSFTNLVRPEDDRPLTAPEILNDPMRQNATKCIPHTVKTTNVNSISVCQSCNISEENIHTKSIHLSKTLSNQKKCNTQISAFTTNSSSDIKLNFCKISNEKQILQISHVQNVRSEQSQRDISEQSEAYRPQSRLGFNDELTSEMDKPFSESDNSNCLIIDSIGESSEERFSELGDERDVFKIEVATSPLKDLEECKCKEEVEIEEDKALVEALLKSEQQTELPNVPGLKCLPKDSHVTDQANTDNVEAYIENLHWVKGPSIGTGGFCTCYLARDKRTGTLMACKQICLVRNKQEDEEDEIEKIETEIRLIGNLSHPNILRLLGATRHGSHFFMFTEWMPGGSVANLLDTYGPFTEHVTVNYIRQVILGLSYLHESRILHRDLKGANLVVDSSGQRLRIADFGASATLKGDITGLNEFRNELMGTIPFMAPEVLKGESYGRSADVWSVGCVIIQMLTAKPPWSDRKYERHYALIFRIGSANEGPPLPVIESPPLKDLCLRCLEIDKKDRSAAKDLIKHPLFTLCVTT